MIVTTPVNSCHLRALSRCRRKEVADQMQPRNEQRFYGWLLNKTEQQFPSPHELLFSGPIQQLPALPGWQSVELSPRPVALADTLQDADTLLAAVERLHQDGPDLSNITKKAKKKALTLKSQDKGRNGEKESL